MPDLSRFDLLRVIQDLGRRLDEHAEADDANYWDFLDEDQLETLIHIDREEVEMLQVLEEIDDGSAPEWLKAFANTVEATNGLRTFVLGLRAIDGTFGIDMGQLIEHWPKLDPNVQSVMAWLSCRCASLHEDAESSNEELDAGERERIATGRKLMRTLMTTVIGDVTCR